MYSTPIAFAISSVMHDGVGAPHTVTAYLLVALATLHIAGALKHQFMDKEAE